MTSLQQQIAQHMGAPYDPVRVRLGQIEIRIRDLESRDELPERGVRELNELRRERRRLEGWIRDQNDR